MGFEMGNDYSHSETRMSDVVYRVQDNAGRGPWRPGFSDSWVEDRPDEEFLALSPWPMEFGHNLIHIRGTFGMHFGCGCTSIEQLRRWFSPTEYAKLLTYGYRAVKMDAGHILANSKVQCVFERAKPLNEGCEPIELYP